MIKTAAHPFQACCVVAVTGLALLAGCGSSTAGTQGGGDQQGSGSSGQPGGMRQPGAAGEIAEVDGSTMQVQSTSEQTAVRWTSKTSFTQEVKATRSAITVGSCVIVRGDGDAGDSPMPTHVSAQSVAVMPAGRDGCAGFGGFGGFAGNRGNRPAQAPSDRPSGSPGARPVTGTVTAVSASSITVAVREPNRAASPAGSTPKPGTSPSPATTRSVTVTTGAGLAVTERTQATAKAVKVGLCATAQGTTNDTGALTASSIALSSKVDGSCASGFGRRGGGQGNG